MFFLAQAELHHKLISSGGIHLYNFLVVFSKRIFNFVPLFH